MIGPILDFLKFIIVHFRIGGKVEQPVDLTAVYNHKRASLEKNEIALLELLEENPGKWIRTVSLFNAWARRCRAWFGTPESRLSEGEVRSTLKDWSNDEHPLVLVKQDDEGRTRWKLNPEYDSSRTKRPPEPTIFRGKTSAKSKGKKE